MQKRETLTLSSETKEPKNPDKLIIDVIQEALYYPNIQAANSKQELKKFIVPKNTRKALEKKKFLHYGSASSTSFIIIDIDHETRDIKTYNKEVLYKLSIKPSWLLKSDNGYHVGFILNKTLWMNNTKEKEKAQELKRNLTTLLNGDSAGSYRLYGIWRNPLQHQSITDTKTHNLDDLFELSKIQLKNNITLFDNEEIKKKKISNSNMTKEQSIALNAAKLDLEGFKIGNRNNFLYKKIIGLLHHQKIRKPGILEALNRINNSKPSISLNQKEIFSLEKSLLNAHINLNNTKEEYKPGPYHNDLWTNQIHNFKDRTTNKQDYSRQKFGQVITTSKKIINTAQDLLDAMIKTYENKELFTNDVLVQNSNRCKRTIQIWRNERKVLDEIKISAFKIYMKSLTEPGDTPMLYSAAPLNNLLDIVLSNQSFIYERTGQMFAFKMNEVNRLIFYDVTQYGSLEAA